MNIAPVQLPPVKESNMLVAILTFNQNMLAYTINVLNHICCFPFNNIVLGRRLSELNSVKYEYIEEHKYF